LSKIINLDTILSEPDKPAVCRYKQRRNSPESLLSQFQKILIYILRHVLSGQFLLLSKLPESWITRFKTKILEQITFKQSRMEKVHLKFFYNKRNQEDIKNEIVNDLITLFFYQSKRRDIVYSETEFYKVQKERDKLMSKLSALSGQQVERQSDELTPGTDDDETEDEEADLDIELQSLTDELLALDTQLSLLQSTLEASTLSVLSEYRQLTGRKWSRTPSWVPLRSVFTI